jgi:glycosyltransferase involved in cell wall biosynthesis
VASPAPLTILHVDPSTEFRGGQRQLELLVQGLAARGHRQTVACVPGSPLAARLDVPILPLLPGNAPRNALRLAGVPHQVVAAHTSHAHGACVAAGLRPIVHRRVDFAVRSNTLKLRRARGFIAVSQAVADILARAGAQRVQVVHDGVPACVPAEPAELGEGPIVLAVGALVDHKDHATLARAAERIEARVLVAGEGPLRSELASTRLELLGQRDDVPALMARAQVFVHPSKLEGMGQVVVEALRARIPVVATAAGGVPEVVGAHGRIVPVGDAAALADAVRAALRGDHPDLHAAARHGDRFSVDEMVRRTEAAYDRLIEPS